MSSPPFKLTWREEVVGFINGRTVPLPEGVQRPSALAVVAQLMQAANGDGTEVLAAQSWLEAETGVHHASVRTLIAWLIEHGQLIDTGERRGRGRVPVYAFPADTGRSEPDAESHADSRTTLGRRSEPDADTTHYPPPEDRERSDLGGSSFQGKGSHSRSQALESQSNGYDGTPEQLALGAVYRWTEAVPGRVKRRGDQWRGPCVLGCAGDRTLALTFNAEGLGWYCHNEHGKCGEAVAELLGLPLFAGTRQRPPEGASSGESSRFQGASHSSTTTAEARV